MKKTFTVFLLFLLAFSLLSCNDDSGRTLTKADGTVDYRQGGLAISLPKYLAASDDADCILYTQYVPEKLEYSVSVITPQTLLDRGFTAEVTAEDFATVFIDDIGLNDLNAEVTGSYETLLPTPDGENAYFAFGDCDLEDEDIHLYKQVYVRRSDDGSMWLFYGVCNEEYMDSYSVLFMQWARSAEFYTE